MNKLKRKITKINNKNQVFKQFEFFGRELYKKDLVSATSGNLSLKSGQYIYITKTGSQLGFLKPEDIVKVTLKNNCPLDKLASSELPAHRTALQNSLFNALIHAHPPFTIALSLKFKKIKPIDLEGKYYFSEVPVIKTQLKPGAFDLPKKLLNALNKSKIVVVAGHGVFSVGKNFKEAFNLISSLEASAKIIYLTLTNLKKIKIS